MENNTTANSAQKAWYRKWWVWVVVIIVVGSVLHEDGDSSHEEEQAEVSAVSYSGNLSIEDISPGTYYYKDGYTKTEILWLGESVFITTYTSLGGVLTEGAFEVINDKLVSMETGMTAGHVSIRKNTVYLQFPAMTMTFEAM
jgi:hypothetical protein